MDWVTLAEVLRLARHWSTELRDLIAPYAALFEVFKGLTDVFVALVIIFASFRLPRLLRELRGATTDFEKRLQSLVFQVSDLSQTAGAADAPEPPEAPPTAAPRGQRDLALAAWAKVRRAIELAILTVRDAERRESYDSMTRYNYGPIAEELAADRALPRGVSAGDIMDLQREYNRIRVSRAEPPPEVVERFLKVVAALEAGAPRGRRR